MAPNKKRKSATPRVRFNRVIEKQLDDLKAVSRSFNRTKIGRAIEKAIELKIFDAKNDLTAKQIRNKLIEKSIITSDCIKLKTREPAAYKGIKRLRLRNEKQEKIIPVRRDYDNNLVPYFDDGEVVEKIYFSKSDQELSFLPPLEKMPEEVLFRVAELILEGPNLKYRSHQTKILNDIRKIYLNRRHLSDDGAVYFEWPSYNKCHKKEIRFSEINWQEEGLMRLHGYSVSEAFKISSSSRKAVLGSIFAMRISKEYPIEAITTWGDKFTSIRLERMARSISHFTKLASGRDADMTQAISRWEEDLEWLRKNYYEGFFRFNWPCSKCLFKK